jgi:hypothetical protein
MWLAAQAKRHPAPDAQLHRHEITQHLYAQRLEFGWRRCARRTRVVDEAAMLATPPTTPCRSTDRRYLRSATMFWLYGTGNYAGAAGGRTWRGSRWRNSLTSFSRSPVFCIPGRACGLPPLCGGRPAMGAPYRERRKWSPYGLVSHLRHGQAGTENFVDTPGGAAMVRRQCDSVRVREAECQRENPDEEEADGPGRIQIEPTSRHELQPDVAIHQPC